jgi:hypothetical protein
MQNLSQYWAWDRQNSLAGKSQRDHGQFAMTGLVGNCVFKEAWRFAYRIAVEGDLPGFSSSGRQAGAVWSPSTLGYRPGPQDQKFCFAK